MKNKILKKFETERLNYSHTNEDLRSIVFGLEINSTDHVFAIAGSGDQAFAILEFAKKVTIIDVNPIQIRYIKKRVSYIKKGNYQEFLKIKTIGLRDNLQRGKFKEGYSRFNLTKRNEYFLKRGRLVRIRKNLKNLKFNKGADITKIFQEKTGYSKIYLSNIFQFNYQINDWDPFVKNFLRQIVKKLPTGVLIYLSGHPKQLKIRGLKLDKKLTQKARQFETTNWSPAIYRTFNIFENK